ncbi:uncharacterized protein LOC126896325 [Daktulosphaira vitifoliae]|uniref:uncharacterized protein LOC126896325 n=1 Tax=Daktulosphaira vitifoliae TaxID=58002 RepID=UPI0021AA3D71|nr:uncharacterized protein LOC126896325 [Daktulosphaira vitifoliae]
MSNTSTMEELSLVLKPDNEDRKIIFIEETGTSKGDIIISFYLWRLFNRTNHTISMIGFRDTFGHYHSLGMKLHYNLLIMVNKNRFKFSEGNLSVKFLYSHLEKLVDENKNGPIYLIIDDISILMLMNESIENIIEFLIYVKNLERIYLIFGCWRNKVDNLSKRLAAAASHLSDLKIALAPLATGFSDTATGTMRITSFESIFNINDVSYLYKLFDNNLTLKLNSDKIR